MPRRQGAQRLADMVGPGPVITAHRGHHHGGGVGDEGARQDRIDADQVQRQAHDHPGPGRIGLDRRPGGCGLQVFIAHHPDTAQLCRRLAQVHRLHEGLIVAHARPQIGDQGGFLRAERPARRHRVAQLRRGEFGNARHQVAQHIGQVLVDRGLEVFPGKLAVGILGRMRQQPPAPVVRRQDRQRLIHEHATPLAGGKLAAVIVQVVERLDVIDQLPRLARPHDRGGEAERVEGHVVLAHELDIAHITRAPVGAPPAFPVGFRQAIGIGPFSGAGDVFDGRVEPDIEDLAFHARPGLIALLHRHAPIQVTGDAPVLQPVAVVQPFPGDRGGQNRPIGLAVDPGLQLCAQRALTQVKVLGFAHLKIGGAGNGRAGVDQVGRVQLLGAVFALIAPRPVIAAVRAGAFDITVGQKAVVGDGKDLLFAHLLDQPVFGQLSGKMLGQAVVALAGRAAKMVEGQAEAIGNALLHGVHLGAELFHRLAGLGGGEFGRGAMFIGGAKEQHLMPAPAQVARVKVGGQL